MYDISKKEFNDIINESIIKDSYNCLKELLDYNETHLLVEVNIDELIELSLECNAVYSRAILLDYKNKRDPKEKDFIGELDL